MTIEEKRQALIDFCHKQKFCYDCPLSNEYGDCNTDDLYSQCF